MTELCCVQLALLDPVKQWWRLKNWCHCWLKMIFWSCMAFLTCSDPSVTFCTFFFMAHFSFFLVLLPLGSWQKEDKMAPQDTTVTIPIVIFFFLQKNENLTDVRCYFLRAIRAIPRTRLSTKNSDCEKELILRCSRTYLRMICWQNWSLPLTGTFSKHGPHTYGFYILLASFSNENQTYLELP